MTEIDLIFMFQHKKGHTAENDGWFIHQVAAITKAF